MLGPQPETHALWPPQGCKGHALRQFLRRGGACHARRCVRACHPRRRHACHGSRTRKSGRLQECPAVPVHCRPSCCRCSYVRAWDRARLPHSTRFGYGMQRRISHPTPTIVRRPLYARALADRAAQPNMMARKGLFFAQARTRDQDDAPFANCVAAGGPSLLFRASRGTLETDGGAPSVGLMSTVPAGLAVRRLAADILDNVLRRRRLLDEQLQDKLQEQDLARQKLGALRARPCTGARAHGNGAAPAGNAAASVAGLPRSRPAGRRAARGNRPAHRRRAGFVARCSRPRRGGSGGAFGASRFALRALCRSRQCGAPPRDPRRRQPSRGN